MQIKGCALGFLERTREINHNRYSWNQKKSRAITRDLIFCDSMSVIGFIFELHFFGTFWDNPLVELEYTVLVAFPFRVTATSDAHVHVPLSFTLCLRFSEYQILCYSLA